MDSIIPKNVEIIRINKRAISVPYKYRILYMISQISLILHICGGKRASSLLKVQIISTAISSRKEFEKLITFLNDGKSPLDIIRFDPSVNRGIDFAIAEKIIHRQKNGLFKLSNKGKIFINEIIKDKEIFLLEKKQLNIIADRLTEEKIEQLKTVWSDFDVKN
ncbi:hypothetical protein [uncultured Metabacillus sp.]|uniref:hypothetical protein n=1 Tax=uncultured Metabacillus sp. TaxID=2860135 RepID=UPI002636EEEE|nr:hypothetical protein [uncultured Metabacillus sp.]